MKRDVVEDDVVGVVGDEDESGGSLGCIGAFVKAVADPIVIERAPRNAANTIRLGMMDGGFGLG